MKELAKHELPQVAGGFNLLGAAFGSALGIPACVICGGFGLGGLIAATCNFWRACDGDTYVNPTFGPNGEVCHQGIVTMEAKIRVGIIATVVGLSGTLIGIASIAGGATLGGFAGDLLNTTNYR